MRYLLSTLLLTLALGCSSGSSVDASSDAAPSAQQNAADLPIDGVSATMATDFAKGDRLFELPFRPADGLGPLFVRTSCAACHDGAARGPGLVQKMSVVESDGVTAASDQSELPFGHSVRQGLVAGATTPIEPPKDPAVRVSTRVGPPVLGRGYVEAIDAREILRVEAEQAARSDGIHGRAHHVTFVSQPNPDLTFAALASGALIGRFGDKARIATIDDFVADAFQGDMGMTTPLRPEELPNPDALKDDLRTGVDLTAEHVNRVAFYVRLIAIPPRSLPAGGAALFERAKCTVCHVPSLRTRADYPISLLASIDAPVYSDLLLHDMGDELADGLAEGAAGSRDWKTTPLIGTRFSKTFLHDGRAPSLEAAILAHGGR